MSTYSLHDAANILKVSPERLRHWKRTALSHADAEPPPRRDRVRGRMRPDFDFRDLVCVRAILGLVDQGVSVRRIRRAVAVLQENIPDLNDPLAALRLWSEGSERIVVRHEGVLIEPEGQMVLDFKGELDVAPEPASIEDRARHPHAVLEESMQQFEEGCRLDSDPSSYHDAMVAYERAIELDEGFADAHCNLGAVLYNAGKRKSARRSFERCLQLDSQHVEANFNLANLLEESGCDEMAMRHYHAALRADPFYADVHVNLALLYERLGSHRAAREHWRRYLQLDPKGAWSEVARQRLMEDAPR